MSLLHWLVALWLLIAATLCREYLILNGALSGSSVLEYLNAQGFFGAAAMGKPLSTKAGGPLSFRMGIIGFSIICLTNLYILRKRLPRWQKLGKVSVWLDFHIFCGLLGPTLIVFHSNFRVSGLVAISFWSMMTSFFSGIAGRYLYVQILSEREVLRRSLMNYERRFKKLEKINRKLFSPDQIKKLKEDAFIFAGGSLALAKGQADMLTVLSQSVVGDLRLKLGHPPVPKGFPRNLKRPLKEYALMRRRLAATGYFRRLMGYWHSFHFPFAVFMYAVTLIHIASAMIFRVDH